MVSKYFFTLLEYFFNGYTHRRSLRRRGRSRSTQCRGTAWMRRGAAAGDEATTEQEEEEQEEEEPESDPVPTTLQQAIAPWNLPPVQNPLRMRFTAFTARS